MDSSYDIEQGCSKFSDFIENPSTLAYSVKSKEKIIRKKSSKRKTAKSRKSSKKSKDISKKRYQHERDYKDLLEKAWGLIPEIEQSTLRQSRTAEMTSVDSLEVYMDAAEAIYGFEEKDRRRYLRILQYEKMTELAPYFANLVKESIDLSLSRLNLDYVTYTMKLIQSLLKNDSIDLSDHLNIILPTVVFTGLAGKVCESYKENHWSMRELTAKLVAEILKKYSSDVQISKMVIKSYKKLVKSPKDYAFPSIYGAVQGLMHLGQKITRNYLLPYIIKISPKIMEAEHDHSPSFEARKQLLMEMKYVREAIILAAIPIIQRERYFNNDSAKYIKEFGYIGRYIYEKIKSNQQLKELKKGVMSSNPDGLSSVQKGFVIKSKMKRDKKLPLSSVHPNIYCSSDKKSLPTEISLDHKQMVSSSFKGKSLVTGKSYKKTSAPKRKNPSVSDTQISKRRPTYSNGVKKIKMEDGQQGSSHECQTSNESVYTIPSCENYSELCSTDLPHETSEYITNILSPVGSDHTFPCTGNTPINSEGWGSVSSTLNLLDVEGIDELLDVYAADDNKLDNDIGPIEENGNDDGPMLSIYSQNDTLDPNMMTSLFSIKEDDYSISELNTQPPAGCSSSSRDRNSDPTSVNVQEENKENMDAMRK